MFKKLLALVALFWLIGTVQLYRNAHADAATAIIPATTVKADPTDGTVTYIGKVMPGTATSAAKWQITKLTFSSGNFTGQTWADGNGNYDNVWDDRASLTYQ